MKTAVYSRLSRYRGGGVSESVQIQEAEARECAAAQGWEVVVTRSDDDISASRYTRKIRPGYRQLIEDVRAGQIEAILVTEMSRLYRRLEELLELLHLAESTSLRRIETTDGLAYHLDTGEGVHSAVAAVNSAVLESRRTSDRMKRRKRAQAREGRFGGGVRPFGYEKDGLTVREDEALVIREVAAGIIQGESLYAICRELHDRGIVGSTGQPFQRFTLKRLMAAKRIIGIRTHNGEAEYPAQWPAILDRETWNRVQSVLRAERRLNSIPDKPGYRTYLFTGLVFCGRPDCGAPMIGQGANGVRKYGCRVDQVVERRSYHLSRQAEPVERLVGEAVLLRLDSPKFARALARTDNDIDQVHQRYFEQKARLDELVTDYGRGLLSREQLTIAKAAAEEALEATKRELSRLEYNHVLANVPAGQTLREAWNNAGTDWRRSLVNLVVSKVIILPGRPGEKKWRDKHTGKEYYFNPDHVRIIWRV